MTELIKYLIVNYSLIFKEIVVLTYLKIFIFKLFL